MRFTIVTPSFNQLDWLELCIASVRDQVESAGADGEKVGKWEFGSRAERDRLERSDSRGAGSPAGEINVGRWEGGRRAEATKSEETRTGISIEHIVQDAGTPGIEDFAREMGGEFYLDGKKVGRLEGNNVGRCEGGKAGSEGYSLTIYSEKDAGMYDAINKGLRRATGEVCAYLNCDEQYLPGTLAAVAEWFGRNKAREVAFGDIVVVRPDGSYICDRTAMVPTKLHTLVSGNLAVYSASTFFRREAVVDRGLLFSPDWKVVGDSVWILSLLAAGLKMGLLRRRVASFIYSGENLSLDAKGTEERTRLRSKACAGARLCAPAIVALFRLRRMLRGGYSLAAQDYAIYTSDGGFKRTAFQVEHPTHRWPKNQVSL
jgi:glycosyltransferase involved in cell wall biosynthesis